jgi:putative transposase
MSRFSSLLTVLRYVERNPVRAGLAARAQDWPWSSAAPPRFGSPSLDAGPVPRPLGWLEQVNTAQTEAEVEALRECVRRRRPYGDSAWAEQVAVQLGLEASLRPRGRPRKKTPEPLLFGRIGDPE